MMQMYDPFDPGQWADAPGCEAFEIALTMRSEGALSPDSVPVLDAHLAACESCRDFAARIGGVRALAPVEPHRWPEVEAELQARVRSFRRWRPWRIAASFAASCALVSALATYVGHVRVTFATFAPAMAFVAVFAVFWYFREIARMRRALTSRDALAIRRLELARTIDRGKRAVLVGPIVLAIEVRGLWHAIGFWRDDVPGAGDRVLMYGLFIALVGAATVVVGVRALAARRELGTLR